MKRSEIKRQLLTKLKSVQVDVSLLEKKIKSDSSTSDDMCDWVRDMSSDVLSIYQYLTLLHVKVENDE